MPNVVRFALPSARDLYVEGAGFFNDGILDIDANNLLRISRARYLTKPYGATEVGIVDSETPPPDLPAVPVAPPADPYPQYLDPSELLDSGTGRLLEAKVPARLADDALKAALGSLDGNNTWTGTNDFAQAPTVNGTPIEGGAGTPIGVGTEAERPGASAAGVDALFIVTDDGANDDESVLYRSDGSSWLPVLATVDPGDLIAQVGGREERVNLVAASGAAQDIDLSLGNVHDITLTADCTLTIVNPPNLAGSFTLVLRQDPTGGHTAAISGGVLWPVSAPALAMPASGSVTLELHTTNGGESWRVRDRQEYGFSPAILDLFGWYHADDLVGVDLASVALWQDRSIEGIALEQAVSGAQPKISAAGLNGHRAVLFDGTDDNLASLSYSSTPVAQPITAYAVVQPSVVSGTRQVFNLVGMGVRISSAVWELRGASGTFVTGPAATVNQPVRLCAIYDGASSELWIDGVQVATGSLAVSTAQRTYVGVTNSGSSFWSGYKRQLMFARGHHSAALIADVDAYLAAGAGL